MADTDIGIKVIVSGVAEAHRQIGALRNDLTRASADVSSLSGHINNFGRDLVKVGDALVSFGRTLTFAVSAPILGASAAFLRAGIEFEDAFAGVTKTIPDLAVGFEELAVQMYGTAKGLTDDQKAAVFANEAFGDLTVQGEDLRNRFRDLSLAIPVSAAELSKMGQIAGQLGVRGSDQIVTFTKIVAELGVATDLAGEQAAFAIARFANILGVADDQMGEFAESFASALVALGNTSAATESEITNLALRLSAAGRAADLSAQEILGISASLAEMGVKAERGGTAVSRVLYEMIFAIADGGENLAQFAQIAGVSTSEFSALFKRDAVAALDLFMTRLADLQDTGAITAQTLTDLGLSGVRVREVLNILGPNMESVRDNIKTANVAWAEQIALQEEATKRFATFKSQLQLLKNAFTDLGITIFDLVKDDLAALVTRIREGVQWFKELDDSTKKMIIRVGMIAATVGPALLVIGTLAQISGNAAIGIGLLTGKLQGLLSLPFKPFIALFNVLSGGLGGLTNIVKNISVIPKLLFSALTLFVPFKTAFVSIRGLLGKEISSLVIWIASKFSSSILQGRYFVDIGKLIFGSIVTGAVSGSKTLFGKVGNILNTGFLKLWESSVFGPIISFFKYLPKNVIGFLREGAGPIIKEFKTIIVGGLQDTITLFGKIFNFLVGDVLKAGLGGLKTLVNTVVSGLSGALGTISKIGSFIGTFIIGPFSSLLGVIGNVLLLPLKAVGSIITKVLIPAFGSLAKAGLSTIGNIGKSLFGMIPKLAGFIPVLGNFLFSGILGIFTKLPLILGGIFAVMFGPKIISGAIKNWDKVLGELKTSASQFVQDMKESGFEKALLLFVSGGSTGSGRKGGIYGIAKALGASEDSARKFSYALGTATVWIIKIAKSVGDLVRRMAAVAFGAKSIGDATKSTGDRLSSLTANIAKFFEGFYAGWTGKFDDIASSFGIFIGQVKEAASRFGELFDSIFGTAKKEQQDFQDSLEPGVQTTASRIGQTVGEVVGGLINIAIRSLTVLVSLAGSVASAFKQIVDAYKQDGLKGVFEELGPILSGLFDGVVFAVGMLWDNVKPGLTTFLGNIWNWITTEGAPALVAGAASLFQGFVDIADKILNGFSITQDVPITRQVNSVLIPGEEPKPVFQTDYEQKTVAFEGVLPKLQRFVGDIKDFLSSDDTKQSIRDGVSSLFNGIVDVANYLWEGGEGFSGIKTPFNKFLDDATNWIEETGIPTAKQWGNKFGNALLDGMKDVITPDDLEAVGKAIESGDAGEISSAIAQLFLPGGSGTKSIPGFVNPTQFWTQKAGEVKEGVLLEVGISEDERAQIVKEFNDLGLSIPEELAKGLEQGKIDQDDVLYLHGLGIGETITEAAREYLGIQSPSKVFKEIGTFTVKGFVEGVTNNLPSVTAVATTLVSKVKEIDTKIRAIQWSSLGKYVVDTFASAITTNLPTLATATFSLIAKFVNVDTAIRAIPFASAVKGIIDMMVITINTHLPTLNTAIFSVIAKFSYLQSSLATIGVQIATTVSNMINSMNMVSTVAASVMGSVAGSGVMGGFSSVANNTYSPTFYGPPAPATYQQNQSLYNDYLNALPGVG